MTLHKLRLVLRILLTFYSMVPSTAQTGGGENPACNFRLYFLCDELQGMNYPSVNLEYGLEDVPCTHYLEFCNKQGGLLSNISTPEPRSFVCGMRNPNGYGGSQNEAGYGEFPWMVSLIAGDNSNDVMCGGSMIHNQIVLTAAHCVIGETKLKVRAGEWNIKTGNETNPVQERNVMRVIIHKEYCHSSYYNDIALLVLDSAFDMGTNNAISTICLPEDQDKNMNTQNCLVTGWGRNAASMEHQRSDILEKIHMSTFNRGDCQRKLRRSTLGQFFQLHNSTICAKGIHGRDPCEGYGGGPLVCSRKDNNLQYMQVGIISWGLSCSYNSPGVYVNVPLFREWIYKKVEELGFSLE